MVKKRIIPDGVRCLYCRTKFDGREAHPVAIEFINGYPALCRKIGEMAVGLMPDNETPEIWLETATREEVVW